MAQKCAIKYYTRFPVKRGGGGHTFSHCIAAAYTSLHIEQIKTDACDISFHAPTYLKINESWVYLYPFPAMSNYRTHCLCTHQC